MKQWCALYVFLYSYSFEVNGTEIDVKRTTEFAWNGSLGISTWQTFLLKIDAVYRSICDI